MGSYTQIVPGVEISYENSTRGHDFDAIFEMGEFDGNPSIFDQFDENPSILD